MQSSRAALVFLFLMVVFLGGLGSPARADGLDDRFTNLALRGSGELLELVAGTYGEFFPEGALVAAETPVLVLEIGSNDGPLGRLLVPGTEDATRESQPLLFYDAVLDSAVMVWRCATSENSFRLDFTTLRVGEGGLVWSDIFSVEGEGGVADFTVEPSLALTRDRFTLELENGQLLETRQSTIHLFWHQEEAVRYTTLSFLEGVYAGWNEVLDLTSSFLRTPEGEEEAGTGSLSGHFEGFLEVQPGADSSTLLVTFANAATARLGTLALRAVPLRISALGDTVRQEIFEAADVYDPEDLSPFMEKVGGSIVIIGHRYRLHPAIIDYLAGRIDTWILENGAEYGLEQFMALVEDAGNLTVDITSSVYASTALDPFDPDQTIVEIDLGGFLDGLENPPSQFIDVEERSNMTPPAVAGVPRVFTSASGEDLLLVWPSASEGGGLDYLESRGGAPWGVLHKLKLTEALEAELAYNLLQKKIR
jgi:hypothetical protein